MKSLFGNSKGFTLIELMVVMTIMSVLAAIVVPQVTGTVTTGRGTAKTQDVSQIQQAVQRYVTDSGKYPVAAGTTSAAGALPTSGEGSKPIDWSASFTSGASTKHFSIGISATAGTQLQSGDYVFSNVKHATAVGSATTMTTTSILTVDGDLLNPNPGNLTTPTPTTAQLALRWSNSDATNSGVDAVWRIDSTGKVFVNLLDSEY